MATTESHWRALRWPPAMLAEEARGSHQLPWPRRHAARRSVGRGHGSGQLARAISMVGHAPSLSRRRREGHGTKGPWPWQCETPLAIDAAAPQCGRRRLQELLEERAHVVGPTGTRCRHLAVGRREARMRVRRPPERRREAVVLEHGRQIERVRAAPRVDAQTDPQSNG